MSTDSSEVADLPTGAAGATAVYEADDTDVDTLRAKANVMQTELGAILASVRSIKDNCTKLKTENRSLQEYIESLMAKR